MANIRTLKALYQPISTAATKNVLADVSSQEKKLAEQQVMQQKLMKNVMSLGSKFGKDIKSFKLAQKGGYGLPEPSAETEKHIRAGGTIEDYNQGFFKNLKDFFNWKSMPDIERKQYHTAALDSTAREALHQPFQPKDMLKPDVSQYYQMPEDLVPESDKLYDWQRTQAETLPSKKLKPDVSQYYQTPKDLGPESVQDNLSDWQRAQAEPLESEYSSLLPPKPGIPAPSGEDPWSGEGTDEERPEGWTTGMEEWFQEKSQEPIAKKPSPTNIKEMLGYNTFDTESDERYQEYMSILDELGIDQSHPLAQQFVDDPNRIGPNQVELLKHYRDLIKKHGINLESQILKDKPGLFNKLFNKKGFQPISSREDIAKYIEEKKKYE